MLQLSDGAELDFTSDILAFDDSGRLSERSAVAVERAFTVLDTCEWRQGLISYLFKDRALEILKFEKQEGIQEEGIQSIALLVAYEILNVFRESFNGGVDQAKMYFRPLLKEALTVLDPNVQEQITLANVEVVLLSLRDRFHIDHSDLDLSSDEIDELFIRIEAAFLADPKASESFRKLVDMGHSPMVLDFDSEGFRVCSGIFDNKCKQFEIEDSNNPYSRNKLLEFVKKWNLDLDLMRIHDLLKLVELFPYSIISPRDGHWLLLDDGDLRLISNRVLNEELERGHQDLEYLDAYDSRGVCRFIGKIKWD